MLKLDCIIVEDEPLALEKTRAYVEKIQYLNLISVFENGMDALNFLREKKADLIFLDINMDGFSGIQLLETVRTESKIIITSAYDQYALKGYDLNVTDYLLKPFTFERFLQATEKVYKLIQHKDSLKEKKFIFVKTEYRLEKIFLHEIIYIEGMRDYRRIHCTDKKIMTLQTFKDLETEIPSPAICRVHKSFMVSVEKIESVERDRIRIGELYIPVSETYRKSFFDIIRGAD